MMQASVLLIYVAVPLISIAQQTLAVTPAGTPDRLIAQPLECDIIQLKSMESAGYLGVGSDTTGNIGEAVTADHAYHSPATHFQVTYYTKPSNWMALSVSSHGAAGSNLGKQLSYLSFNQNGRPQMSELSNLSENISFVLSGWPVTRDSTHRVISVGPYYRMHLVDENNSSHRIATVGVDSAGRVMLYPTEDVTRGQGELSAKPPTLFLLSVFHSPGLKTCRHLHFRKRHSRRHSSAAFEADSVAKDRPEKRRRRATEMGRSSASFSILVNRLLRAARQQNQ